MRVKESRCRGLSGLFKFGKDIGVGMAFVATERSFISASSEIMCTLTFFISPSRIAPDAIRRCTKDTDRNSPSSAALKLISLIRL